MYQEKLAPGDGAPIPGRMPFLGRFQRVDHQERKGKYD